MFWSFAEIVFALPKFTQILLIPSTPQAGGVAGKFKRGAAVVRWAQTLDMRVRRSVLKNLGRMKREIELI